MTRQWLRKASLVVADDAGQGIELSGLRFTFKVRQADVQTPNNAVIRVYNLSDDTAKTIQEEFKQISLRVGYGDDELGTIFEGTIKQARRGREDSVTSYVDILGADGDKGLNFGIINLALAAGSSREDRIKALAAAMNVPIEYFPPDADPAVLPRGVTMYGMARDHLRAECAAAGMTYSVQNGKLVFLPLTGFKPGEAAVLNAKTGMVGWPEQTEEGIKVRCLINPRLEIGCKLQIDNKSIQQALQNPSLQGDLAFQNLQASVPLNDDGVYRIYVIEHSGDSRGNDWLSEITCLSLTGPIPGALVAKI